LAAIINGAKNVPQSNDSVARCIDSSATQIRKRLEKMTNCVYFSLALDELMDIAFVAQLMCFVRCIDADGSVKNSVLTVFPISVTTNSEDIYNMHMEFMRSNNTDPSKLVCMVSDSAPSYVGKNNRFIDLLK
jgi:hypothetical protein